MRGHKNWFQEHTRCLIYTLASFISSLLLFGFEKVPLLFSHMCSTGWISRSYSVQDRRDKSGSYGSCIVRCPVQWSALWKHIQCQGDENNFHTVITKLPEGNVFSRACRPFCPQVEEWPLPMMHWTSLYRTILQPWSQSPLDIGPHCQGTPWPWAWSPSGHWTSLYRNPLSPSSGPPDIGHRTSLYTNPLPLGLGLGLLLDQGWGGSHVWYLRGLYSEVQCIIGNGHMVTLLPVDRMTDRSRLKTLPSQNLVGGK